MSKFTHEEIWSCYSFACKMIGNHNPNMIMDREDWEIFRDDFRGKLAEVGLVKDIQNYVRNAEINRAIDFDVTPQGKWDIIDVVANNKYISVKSVKGNGNFLMIETFRFDKNGKYSYKNNDGKDIQVDMYALVKVDIKQEMEEDDTEYKTIDDFMESKGGRTITYTVMGGIYHDDFWKNKHFAPEGMKCDYVNLNRVCQNAKPDMNEGGGKTDTLQKDNYILNGRKELIPLCYLL